ncbi:MAG: DUF6056 family protein [Alphaproteobacteria bacterium]
MFFDHYSAGTARLFKVMLVGAVAFVAVLSVAFTMLAVPVFDDFCRTNTHGYDLPGYLGQERQEWEGRWAAHIVYFLTFPRLGITSGTLNAVLLLSPVIWFATFLAYLHIFFRKAMSLAAKAALAAVLAAVYFVGLPAPGEMWFWLSDLVVYEIPLFLMAVCLLVMSSQWVTGSKLVPRLGATALAMACGVVATGFNELVGLFLAGALAIGLGLALVRRRWDVVAVLGVLIVAVAAGILFNLAAPGNAIRQASDFPNAKSLSFGLFALASTYLSPLAWLPDARLLCLGALLLTSPWFLRLKPEWITWKLPLPGPLSSIAVLAPIAALGAVLAGMFAVSYAQGSPPPGRVKDELYAFLVIGFLGSLIPLIALARSDADNPGPIVRGINFAACILLPLTLLIAPVTLRAAAELKPVATSWRPLMAERDHLLREAGARGAAEVVLPPIAYTPSTYYWRDLSPDASDWVNVCVAKYYGVGEVRTPASADAPSR